MAQKIILMDFSCGTEHNRMELFNELKFEYPISAVDIKSQERSIQKGQQYQSFKQTSDLKTKNYNQITCRGTKNKIRRAIVQRA